MLRIELRFPLAGGNCTVPAPIMPTGILPLDMHSDITDATISFNSQQSESNRVIQPSFVQDIEFYGDAFYFLKWLFFTCNPLNSNSIECWVYDDCCDNLLVFRGVITATDIEFCAYVDGIKNDCALKVKLQNAATQKTRYDCVRQTLIDKRDTVFPSNNKNFENQDHYFYRYCKESRPRIFSDIFVALYLFATSIINVVISPILAIIAIISTICDLLGIDFDNDTDGQQSLYDTIKDFLSDNVIARFFIGCGKGHVVPRVRHFIENVCIQCGLTFESSILNNANSIYYNVGYLFARAELTGTEYIKNGNQIQPTTDEYFRLNTPNMNGGEFLDQLAPHFNAYWDVVPTGTNSYKLVFEPVLPPSYNWLDFELSDNEVLIKELCFTTSEERTPAILEMQHVTDAADQISNEAELRFDDIVNWKSPVHSYNGADLVGLERINTAFAGCRFRNDGITRDVVSFWLIGSSTLDLLLYLDKVISSILSLRNIIIGNVFNGLAESSTHWLLLNTGTTFAPKLLIPHEGDDRHYQTTLRTTSNQTKNGVPYYWYNYPMWFADNEDLNNRGKIYLTPNLFEQFFQTKNPNLSFSKKGTKFSLTIEYDCRIIEEIYNLIDTVDLRVRIKIPYMGGYIQSNELTSVSINKESITIEGII